MAMPIRKTRKKAWDAVDLAEDGILSAELQDALHGQPHAAHIAAAGQMASIDPATIPRFETVAALIVWVQTVLAAGGNPQATKLIADRLSPVITKSEEKIDVQQRGAPSSSKNAVEREASEAYIRALNK